MSEHARIPNKMEKWRRWNGSMIVPHWGNFIHLSLSLSVSLDLFGEHKHYSLARGRNEMMIIYSSYFILFQKAKITKPVRIFNGEINRNHIQTDFKNMKYYLSPNYKPIGGVSLRVDRPRNEQCHQLLRYVLSSCPASLWISFIRRLVIPLLLSIQDYMMALVGTVSFLDGV